MILLILPLIWAAVLLPPWVLHMRERRADRSVQLFDRRMAALERSSSVRYVFGSYDPYRSVPGRRAGRGREVDRSYVPVGDDARQANGRGVAPEWDEIDDNDEDDVATALASVDEVVVGREVRRREPRHGAGRRPGERRRAGTRRSAIGGGEVVELVPATAVAKPDRVAARPSQTEAEARAARNSRVALRRRRQIFFSLLGIFALSLAAALALGTVALWAAHAATVVFLAAYMALLVRHQHRMAERATKVRRIGLEDRRVAVQRPAVVLVSGGSAR